MGKAAPARRGPLCSGFAFVSGQECDPCRRERFYFLPRAVCLPRPQQLVGVSFSREVRRTHPMALGVGGTLQSCCVPLPSRVAVAGWVRCPPGWRDWSCSSARGRGRTFLGEVPQLRKKVTRRDQCIREQEHVRMFSADNYRRVDSGH